MENVELTKKLIESLKDNYGTTYVGLAGFGYGGKGCGSLSLHSNMFTAFDSIKYSTTFSRSERKGI